MQMQILIICLKCTRIVEIFASLRKWASRNTMVTSAFRPEVEIWPRGVCATKNMQYNPYLMAESPKFLIGNCGLGYWADTTFHRTYF